MMTPVFDSCAKLIKCCRIEFGRTAHVTRDKAVCLTVFGAVLPCDALAFVVPRALAEIAAFHLSTGGGGGLVCTYPHAPCRRSFPRGRGA